MGLFDGFKMAGDLIKGGMRTVKISMKLDELTEKAVGEYGEVLTPKQKEWHQEFVALGQQYDEANKEEEKKKEKDRDTEKLTMLSDQKDAAQIKFLSSVSRNARVPQEFKDEITAAIAEYKDANAHMFDGMKERFLKKAKTEEERKQVEELFSELLSNS